MKSNDLFNAIFRRTASLATALLTIASLGGVMGETVPMGRKQFTYEIDRRKAGLYIDFFFELDPLKVIEIKEKFKLDPRVLRNLIILDERPDSPTTNIKLNME